MRGESSTAQKLISYIEDGQSVHTSFFISSEVCTGSVDQERGTA